jgi:primosomal protein N' (replication factor Y)
LCNRCRTLASCNCGGKLQIKKANSHPSCYLCGEEFKNWHCLLCGDVRPFVIAKGLDRTAEEIARSIPGSTVRKVFSDQDQFSKSTDNQVIVSSRGCEPMINYAGLILLDGEQIYNQPSLRAEEEMKSNWFDLLSRVSDQGFVYISLLNNHPITQQMLIGQSLSTNALQNRKESRLPPYYRTCQVIGESKALSTFSENLRNQNKYIVTGPLTHKGDRKRLIIRAGIEDAPELVNQMQDIVKMQLLKGKSVFEYRFDQYDI